MIGSRLAFGITLALVGLFIPVAVEAQQAAKVARIGYLGDNPGPHVREAFLQGLRDLGYVEGRNVVIEYRYAEGKLERFPALAAELVALKVDVILAPSNPATVAARKATMSIPIVMVLAPDPVAQGFVSSLARPGGNLTGLTSQSPETAGKRLQLLKEAVPNLSRVAALWEPGYPGDRLGVSAVEAAARALGVQLQLLRLQSPDELDGAFAAMTRGRAGAVLVGGFLAFARRAQIAELAVKRRLPTMCVARQYVEAGCLMSYGLDYTVQIRRAAYFVDRILNGVKPADLPVEQPTKFELVVNLKTARALGLTLPQSVLARADHIVE